MRSLSKSCRRFTPKDLVRKEGEMREGRERRRRRLKKEHLTSKSKVLTHS